MGKTAGFTLLELMVVVVILSILAVMIVPNVMDRPDQARVARARQDIRVLESALQFYRLDYFAYPTTEQGLRVLVQEYVDRLPLDPWGNEYHYLSPGIYGDFDVFSYGADGQQGGQGFNADIGNWSE